jgi:hypothetical protein
VRAPRPAPGPAARLRRLDAGTLAEATERPDAFRAAAGEPVAPGSDALRLELAPHAYVCVDGAA